MPFAVTWVYLEIILLSEISQTEKDKYHMISLICGIYKKWCRWTYSRSRNRSTDTDNKLMVNKGEREEGQIRSLGLTYMHDNV